MNTQIAKLPKTGVSHAKNLGGKLETVSTLKVLALNPSLDLGCQIATLVDARFYVARSGDSTSPMRCTVWVSCKGFCTSGHGIASGYGYDKASSALSAALLSSGIGLADDISGRGPSAMHDALISVGHALISLAPVDTYAPSSLTVI